MAYNLIIKPEAENDIDEAIEWYKAQNKELCPKFLNEIEECFDKIVNHPEHYQKRYREIRIIFTKKFPYGIYYLVKRESLFILAILHNKQNPEVVHERKNSP